MFQLLTKTNIDFQGKRHFWMTLSAIVILVGLIFSVVNGVNLSIDFTGGVAMTLRAIAPSGAPALGEEGTRQILEEIGVDGAEVKASRSTEGEDLLIHFKESGRFWTPEALIRAQLDSLYPGKWTVVADDQLSRDGMERFKEISYVAIRTSLSQEELRAVLNNVNLNEPAVTTQPTEQGEQVYILSGKGKDAISRLRFTLQSKYPNYHFEARSIEMVGPRIGSELRNRAILAIIASWVLIIVYLWWRFDLVFGIAAVIALIHDVVITFGIMAMFGYEISMTVVGAFLTLIGYSVNDTIVTFDRIRENLRRYHDMDLKQLINLSINQTLSRTIITNGTVFVVVTVLFVFGGPVLRSFSFAMFIGSIVGTYSSIYIASPILIDYVEKSGRQLAKRIKAK